jgi:hypothetical protein
VVAPTPIPSLRSSPWIKTLPSADSPAPTATPAPLARSPSSGRAAAGPLVGAATSTSAARVRAASAEASAPTLRTPTTAGAAAGRWQLRAQHDTAVATPAASPTAATRSTGDEHRVLDLERGSTAAGEESANRRTSRCTKKKTTPPRSYGQPPKPDQGFRSLQDRAEAVFAGHQHDPGERGEDAGEDADAQQSALELRAVREEVALGLQRAKSREPEGPRDLTRPTLTRDSCHRRRCVALWRSGELSFEGPGSGATVALERQIACRLSGRFYHSGQATTARDMVFGSDTLCHQAAPGGAHDTRPQTRRFGSYGMSSRRASGPETISGDQSHREGGPRSETSQSRRALSGSSA